MFCDLFSRQCFRDLARFNDRRHSVKGCGGRGGLCPATRWCGLSVPHHIDTTKIAQPISLLVAAGLVSVSLTALLLSIH
jgi:hypothetical protein